jgi:hypothetical protein
MKSHIRIAVVVGALALSAAPAVASPPSTVPPDNQGTAHNQANSQGQGPTYTPGDPGNPTPGPRAGLPEKAKAYGRYCQGESKRHVKGEKGTAFSRCVTAMAKAANNDDLSPGRACKGLSKRHVKGEKGTEFSRCVKAAAKLRGNQDQE